MFTVADPGEGPGRGQSPTLFLDQTGARRAKKKFFKIFWETGFPTYLRVWMTAPPPLPRYLKVWICHWFNKSDCTTLDCLQFLHMNLSKDPILQSNTLDVAWQVILSSEQAYNFLFTNASVEFPFLAILSIWGFQRKSLDSKIPKQGCGWTATRVWLQRV